MKPEDKSDPYQQRAAEALAFLRQKIEEIFKSVPNLLDIERLSDLPEAKVEVVELQLWGIFAYGEYYVERVMSDLGTRMRSVGGGNFQPGRLASSGQPGGGVSAESKNNFSFYYSKYPSLIKKVRELIDVSFASTRMHIEIEWVRAIESLDKSESDAWKERGLVLQSDIANHMPMYMFYCKDGHLRDKLRRKSSIELDFRKRMEELRSSLGSTKPLPEFDDEGYKSPLKYETAFDILAEQARGLLEDIHRYDDDEVHLNRMTALMSSVINLANEDYFAPENWQENAKELSPIIVSRNLQQIPRHIRSRVHEIYHSFIFGNWISVIALSRCLLEYVIVDEKSLLKIKNIFDFEKKQYRDLVELIHEAGKIFPELKKDMTHIRKAGNGVMHPPKPRDHPFAEVLQLPPNKAAAKKCVGGIVKIINTLYNA